jgi:hypothetical protein
MGWAFLHSRLFLRIDSKRFSAARSNRDANVIVTSFVHGLFVHETIETHEIVSKSELY